MVEIAGAPDACYQLGAVIAPSFWLATCALLAGAVCGFLAPVLTRLGMARSAARTVAMQSSLGLAVVGSGTAGVLAVARLAESPTNANPCARAIVVLPLPAPVDGVPRLDLTVRLDGLSALFVAVAAACAVAICVYSLGWLRDDPLRDNVAGSFNLFVGATLLVLVVDNVFWLFVALETLTLCSADLVRYRGRRGGSLEASRTAVRTYLIVSQIGLSCLLAGLLPIVVRHGTIDFGALSAAADHAAAGGAAEDRGPVAVASFFLVLLGLAIRAGLVPFHFWVPVVHPQLPTNTHAMMSAVMLKLSVYLIPDPPIESLGLGGNDLAGAA